MDFGNRILYVRKEMKTYKLKYRHKKSMNQEGNPLIGDRFLTIKFEARLLVCDVIKNMLWEIKENLNTFPESMRR